jgi:NAD(P)-dependent dehydrogenase (short-subunit alcohol dehydrogenase family)
VAALGRDPTALAALAGELGDGHLVHAGDVVDLAALDGFYRAVIDRFASIDVVVANAGVAIAAPFESVSEADFDVVIRTNVRGTFFTVQRAVPFLRSGSSVILLSSALGQIGVPELVPYAASKAAIRSFGRTMSAALASRGIRVNVLSPGPVATPIFEKMGLPAEVLAHPDDTLLADVPAARFGTPEEIAAAAVYLASDDTAFMLGSELVIDGGHSQV